MRNRFTTILYQIAHNHWLDELRRTRARPVEVAWDGSEETGHGDRDAGGRREGIAAFPPLRAPAATEPHYHLFLRYQQWRIQEAIARLPETYRLVCVLGQLEGCKVAVYRRLGITFATAMRALMRQDPDIFMVAEMRDLETAEMCVQAALTGHLVLSALHTRDATGALTRLLDMGVEPFLVAATVLGVIGQRLVRRVCPDCKAAYEPPEETLAALGFTPEGRPERFVHGTGCDACSGTGYRGAIGLFEMLTMNEELAQMVVARTPEASLRRRALEMEALRPFLADARAKIADGITTAEEVDRVLLGIYSAGKG